MLSLVLPTYNEAQNIVQLLSAVDAALQHVPHEIIVVDDDSPDGTWRTAMTIAKQMPSLRVLRRTDKKGLSSAIVDGFDAAHGDTFVVMDADGQHDAALLLTMLRSIETADIVIGSRYAPGGSVGDWVTDRRIISTMGTMLAKHLSRVPVSDPLGGFFAIRASVYKTIRPMLRPSGFKILLEILAHLPSHSKVVEVPLIFRMRLHGESKLSFAVHLEFLLQIARLYAGRILGIFGQFGSVLFGIVVAVTIFSFIPRAIAIGRLYAYSSLRSLVMTSLQEETAREGWLLSDIVITHVDWNAVRFIHQDHLRASQPVRQCELQFTPHTLTCDDRSS